MGPDRDLIARYERLADLAEAEAAAAVAGDFERLSELVATREKLRAVLPATAPAAARPALERALAAQEAADHALQAGLADIRRELGRLARGSVQVRGYGATAAPLVDARS